MLKAVALKEETWSACLCDRAAASSSPCHPEITLSRVLTQQTAATWMRGRTVKDFNDLPRICAFIWSTLA